MEKITKITKLKEFMTGIEAKKVYSKGFMLNLSHSKIGIEWLTALAMVLQSGQCPQGLKLDLKNNLFGDEDKEILNEAWAVYEAHQ